MLDGTIEKRLRFWQLDNPGVSDVQMEKIRR